MAGSAGGGLPAPPILLLYHGVDTNFFAPPPDSKAPDPSRADPLPVILSIGRLVEKKGFDILIDAAALLRRRGLKFKVEVVGEGPLRRSLEERIHSLGLDDTFTLRGMLLRED